MPELPEVETIRRVLRNGTEEVPSIVGREIVSVDLLWERTLAYPGVKDFRRRIIGQTILDVHRRGKHLILPLTSDTLLFHLRMSGDLMVEDSRKEVQKHVRLVLNLRGDIRLAFVNPRKFGRVWLLEEPNKILGALGPEPFDPDLTEERFSQMLQVRKRMLKPLLMDQHFIAGLGNIYTDEALFDAGLHPKRLANGLSRLEAARLLGSIRKVLLEGIRRNGASIDWMYRGGGFQQVLRVYQRTGKPCVRCGTPIERMVLGQRGTHFCPRCQPYH